MRHHRKAAPGAHLIQFLGVLFIGLMISALAVDFGYYFAAQNQLQTSADASSLAAATELYRITGLNTLDRQDEAAGVAEDLVYENTPTLLLEDEDVVFGYVDPQQKKYDPSNFTSPDPSGFYAMTGGYNAVFTRVRRGGDSNNAALETLLAKTFGVNDMNAEAQSVAMVDNSIVSMSGVRPIYTCNELLAAAMADGDQTNDIIRIYGDYMSITTPDGVTTNMLDLGTCAPPPSGNWGWADFEHCTTAGVGVPPVAKWLKDGYPDKIDISKCYGTKTGNFISSVSPELDTLVADKTIFPVPLYDTWDSPGGNAHVSLTGFAGFQITAYKDTGAQAKRYIEGHFMPYVCGSDCTTGNGGGDVPGGAVVQVRLASRS